MWQGCQNLCTTQKESCAQNKQMTAKESISDTEEIVKASRSEVQHDGVAALNLLERSPVTPGLPAKDLHGGQTEGLNVRQIKRIDRHPAESDDCSSPARVSDTNNWLNWKCDLHHPNNRENDCEADHQSDIELQTVSEDSETPEQWNVSATLNVAGLSWPIPLLKK